MDLQGLLEALDRAEIVLEQASPQSIRWQAPAGTVPPGLVEEMRRWKGALLRLTAPCQSTWKAEINRWPLCFRAAWCELAESYQRAGQHQAVAEYLAWLDLHEDARAGTP